MEIRLLTAADDLYAVSRVYEESWRCAYRGLVPQDYLDAIPRGHWVPLLERPGRVSLVAVEAGRSSAQPVSARPAFRNTPAAGRCSPSICCLRQWGRAVAVHC